MSYRIVSGRPPPDDSPRFRAKEHMGYVHDLPCTLRGENQHGDEPLSGCSGPIQAHHLLRPWSGQRGMGMKSGDNNTVPLCSGHHWLLHRNGDEMAYFKRLTGDPEFGRKEAERVWRKSPYFTGVGG